MPKHSYDIDPLFSSLLEGQFRPPCQEDLQISLRDVISDCFLEGQQHISASSDVWFDYQPPWAPDTSAITIAECRQEESTLVIAGLHLVSGLSQLKITNHFERDDRLGIGVSIKAKGKGISSRIHEGTDIYPMQLFVAELAQDFYDSADWHSKQYVPTATT